MRTETEVINQAQILPHFILRDNIILLAILYPSQCLKTAQFPNLTSNLNDFLFQITLRLLKIIYQPTHIHSLKNIQINSTINHLQYLYYFCRVKCLLFTDKR